MTSPFISVIIPTYGREEPLVRSIEDVLKQDYPHFEVIVVDQTRSHTPAVQTFLTETAAAGKIQLHTLEWASLPGARNFAVRRAKGDVTLSYPMAFWRPMRKTTIDPKSVQSRGACSIA
jgi:cellulose synthase/poly-beta-1,6-N-acetylglucosamine synthase-like glycosyltransferase